MKRLCVAIALAYTVSHAGVIECKTSSGQSLLTNETSCPPGASFKRRMKEPSIEVTPPKQPQAPKPLPQAGVLECYVSESQTIYTTAQYCPQGTRFKSINFNTRDPSIAAAQGTQNAASVPQMKRSCETLKQLRNYYDRMLEPGMNKEPDTMQKLRNVQKEMHENGCRI